MKKHPTANENNIPHEKTITQQMNDKRSWKWISTVIRNGSQTLGNQSDNQGCLNSIGAGREQKKVTSLAMICGIPNTVRSVDEFWAIWKHNGQDSRMYKLTRGRSRILDRGAWAQNLLKIKGFPLKLPENCMNLKKIMRARRGPLDPLVLTGFKIAVRLAVTTPEAWKHCMNKQTIKCWKLGEKEMKTKEGGGATR